MAEEVTQSIIDVQESNNSMHSILKEFNAVLVAKECDTLCAGDLWISDGFVHNMFTGKCGKERLSRILYDHYFPRASKGEYSHYTNLDAFENILKTQKIRLTSALKRKEQGEYSPFYDKYKEFSFKSSKDNQESYNAAMSGLFYLSLVPHEGNHSDPRSRNMWDDFADSGSGVRIVFDVQTEHPDFRHVNYIDSATPPAGDDLLLQLRQICEKSNNRNFTFASVSKFGAFFVPDLYSDEREVRLLVKKDSDSYAFPFQIESGSGIPFIECPFDHDYARVEMIKVEPGPECNVETVKNIIETHANGKNIQTLPKALRRYP